MLACKQRNKRALGPYRLEALRVVFRNTPRIKGNKHTCVQACTLVNKQTWREVPSPTGLKVPSPLWRDGAPSREFPRHLDASTAGWGSRRSDSEMEVHGQENLHARKQKSLYVNMQACKQSGLCQPKLSL
jgi:hypothetical protein